MGPLASWVYRQRREEFKSKGRIKGIGAGKWKILVEGGRGGKAGCGPNRDLGLVKEQLRHEKDLDCTEGEKRGCVE